MTGDDLLGSSVQARPQQHGLGGQQCHRDDKKGPSRGAGRDGEQGGDQHGGQNDLDGVQGADNEPADAESEGKVMPGARNFSGVSRKEMASTMPSHTNATAAPMSCPVAGIVHAPAGLVDGAGRGTSVPA